jgi:hypothetical protein
LCRPRSTPTNSSGNPRQRETVEGRGSGAGCPRHDAAAKPPWTGLRRPRNRTHPAIPQESRCCCDLQRVQGRRPATNLFRRPRRMSRNHCR